MAIKLSVKISVRLEFDDNAAVPVAARIVHHSHIFMMDGESCRLKQKININ